MIATIVAASTWTAAFAFCFPSSAANPWGEATEIPAVVGAISCTSPGNCTAAGNSTVITETSGTWGQPQTLTPGSGISCVSAGNCTAVGGWMVGTETSGTWGQPQEIKLPSNAGSDPYAGLSDVSCVSAGNCNAAGFYTDNFLNDQAMVVSETSGTWAQAAEITAPSNAGSDPLAFLDGISCASAGNCSAVGEYGVNSQNRLTMAVTETSGTWAQAQEITLPSNAGSGGDALFGISCTSAGNCTGAGEYTDRFGNDESMVAEETSGTWAQATKIEAPSNALLLSASADHDRGLHGISCVSPGNCNAAGDYYDKSQDEQAMVVTETAGTWARAIQVNVPSNAVNVALFGISCVSLGRCTAVGTGGPLGGIVVSRPRLQLPPRPAGWP